MSRRHRKPKELPPAAELLRRIQSGDLDPRNIRQEERHICVELLTAEGHSIHQIAMVLKASERTIARDRAEIRRSNAVVASPGLVAEMAGAIIQDAATGAARLTRMANDTSVSAAIRVRAERGAWRTKREMVMLLQSLGYLPTAAQSIRAHVTHGVQPLSAEAVAHEIEADEAIWREVRPEDEKTAAALASARRRLPPGNTTDGSEGAA